MYRSRKEVCFEFMCENRRYAQRRIYRRIYRQDRMSDIVNDTEGY